MRIYLTARFGRRDEMRQHRETLKAIGHEVTSRWLDEADCVPPRQAAMVDVDDLIQSECVIVFTETSEAGYTTGGRHVELGFAIATTLPILMVGPRENVFCHLDCVNNFETMQQAVEFLSNLE